MALFRSAPMLHSNDRDVSEKFNIDQLFEHAHQNNLHQLKLYTRILNRTQTRIRDIGRAMPHIRQFVFSVPMFIFAESSYNVSECISFVTNSLEKTGFVVQFRGPNNLLISWENWIPSYVRQEFNKQTGNKIDGRGNITVSQSEIDRVAAEAAAKEPIIVPTRGTKEYMSTVKNRPSTQTGVYSHELFEKIDKRILNH